MSEILAQNIGQMEVNQESELNEMLLDIQLLNARIQRDQEEIDRLTRETRIIANHSDRVLLQIEAQLDILQKVV